MSTSVTAFVGYARRGPMNKATQIFSFADYERRFGGLDARSEMSYSLQQFFLNGGSHALVVRVAATSPTALAKASIDLLETAATGAAVLLTAQAVDEGTWGNAVRLDVDDRTTDPATLFNLTVTETAEEDGKRTVVATETFRNLTYAPGAPNHVVDVVNEGSKLVRLAPGTGPAGVGRIPPTGTVSGPVDLGALTFPDTMDVHLDTFTPGPPPPPSPPAGTITLPAAPTTVAALAAALQTALRTLGGGTPRFPNATVTVAGTKAQPVLVAKPGTANPMDRFRFADGGGSLASTLDFDAPERTNVQLYALGAGAGGAQSNPVAGSDGSLPDATALQGSRSAKTGIYALADADVFNLLAIPDTNALGDGAATLVAAAAEAYCEERRAIYLLDLPHGAANPKDSVEEVQAWLDENGSLRHKNAALHFPRPVIVDPLNGGRPRAVPPSGTIAGLCARTDAERGVWKAPAGTDAVLRGVSRLEYKLTDAENGVLNPLAVNCLRTFPTYGNVAWGARTLDGADQKGSQWKYLPVRRMALYLEESLFRGTKWVVFEPNDEPLWSQIRLNVGAFMHSLFLKGAFQGTTPKDAYFVRCDKTTTTQDDVNRGVVNVLVGFAPLKPAEFVVIRLSQIAGQVEV